MILPVRSVFFILSTLIVAPCHFTRETQMNFRNKISNKIVI
jgi:hypothetical protein